MKKIIEIKEIFDYQRYLRPLTKLLIIYAHSAANNNAVPYVFIILNYL